MDDDPHTLRFVRDALTKAGYAVRVTAEPGELADLIRAERPRLVLLDLMLPGTGGIELMAEVPELSDLPVIFISGYGRDETIARAFEAGAADYIVKPFSATELTARVGAALRARAGAEPFVLGSLAIDYERRRVTVHGRAVALTATEYEILRILSVNAGRVVTSESLLRQAWEERESTDTERVRAFVKQLRAKLGDDARRPAGSSTSEASATACQGRARSERPTGRHRQPTRGQSVERPSRKAQPRQPRGDGQPSLRQAIRGGRHSRRPDATKKSTRRSGAVLA